MSTVKVSQANIDVKSQLKLFQLIVVYHVILLLSEECPGHTNTVTYPEAAH